MGNWLARLFSGFQTEKRIVMIGLDAAGKTTILYKIKLGEFVQTIPTIGFNVVCRESRIQDFVFLSVTAALTLIDL